MRYLIALAALVIAASAAAQAHTTEGPTTTTAISYSFFQPRYAEARWSTHRIRENRCRAHAGPHRWPNAGQVLARWRDERLGWARRVRRNARELASRCTPAVIRYVFGAYGEQAMTVAYCESKFSRTATNGQYVGVFQMGHSERQHYGWYTAGAAALVQVRSAYAYFVASGRDWSPWECKPS